MPNVSTMIETGMGDADRVGELDLAAVGEPAATTFLAT